MRSCTSANVDLARLDAHSRSEIGSVMNKLPSPASSTPPRKTATRDVDAPARSASEDDLAAVARSQQGLASAEGFWKSAGRFTKLR